MSKVSDADVEAAAEVIWNDQHRRYGGPWHERSRNEVVVVQTLATARAALEAVSSIHEAEPVAWEGYWPGVGSINSQTVLTRFRSIMEKWEGAEITPLYAHPAPISKGVTVKTLQWEANGRAGNSWWAGELIFEDYYTATDEATGWRVFRHRFLSEADPIEVAYVASLVQAKAAAQQDFNTRVKSCLSHTAGEIGAGGEAEPTRYFIAHDGFVGTVIGRYTRLDGKHGVVMQQDGTNIVHVYGSKWLKPAGPPAEAADKRIAELEAALEPFALVSSEGLIGKPGEKEFAAVNMAADYFHSARAILEPRK